MLTPDLKLKDINVSTVLKDRFNNYWVGSLRNGVFFIPDFENLFFANNDIPSSIARATDFFVTGNAREAIHIQNFNSNDIKKDLLFLNNSNHDIYYLAVDTLRRTIFSTSDSFRMLNYQGQVLLQNSLALKSIVPISNGIYAFAATGFNGILAHKNNEEIKQYQQLKYHSQNNDYVWYELINNVRGKSAAYHVGSGRMYFAGNNGLIEYDKKKLREIKIGGKSLNINHLAFADNRVFASSSNGEMFAINHKGEIAAVPYRGISPDPSASRIKALEGRLFLMSTSTIYEYFFDTGLVKRVLTVHPDYEISDMALSDTKIVVATTKGYIVLGKDFQPQTCQYNLVINTVFVNNIEVDIAKLKALSHADNDLRIDLSIISFDPTAVNLLYYRVNGGEWQAQENDNQYVELRNLKPGKYSVDFLVINEGAHTPRASIDFVIRPPFWLIGRASWSGNVYL